jgi:shikimate dehydrogenase
MSDDRRRRRWALGLLGTRVGHSLSPVLHGAALASVGLEGTYTALEAPDEASLATAIAALRAGALDGLNVTIPWKTAAARRCDVLVGEAARLGAVNTLVHGGGGLAGHNTDVTGLLAALAEAGVGPLAGRPCAVIGAGGAARAALLVAERLGAGELRLWNRTGARAEALASELGMGRATDRLEAALDGAALVLQASASGMDLADADASALASELSGPLALTASDAHVCDLVYRPRRTAWLRAAREIGRTAQDGLPMLVHQAAAAFTLWTGRHPDVSAMRTAAEARLG